MLGITSESALSQGRILLVLAMIWILMAFITKKHRKITVIIYTGIGALFELTGLYSVWKSISGFSMSKISSYLMAALLFLLFVVLLAAIWMKYQEALSEKDNYEENEFPSGKKMDDDQS